MATIASFLKAGLWLPACTSAVPAFAAAHWRGQPWLKDVARRTFDRLHGDHDNTRETSHV